MLVFAQKDQINPSLPSPKILHFHLFEVVSLPAFLP